MQNNNKDNAFRKNTQTTVDLEALVMAGARAAQERVKILGYIFELEQSLRNNRQDREDVIETENAIKNHEARLDMLNQTIKNADAAKKKLLDGLKSQKEEIEDRMEFYSRKIDACTINMYDNRFSNVESDCDAYNEEYSRLYNESRKIVAEIHKIQNIK